MEIEGSSKDGGVAAGSTPWGSRSPLGGLHRPSSFSLFCGGGEGL